MDKKNFKDYGLREEILDSIERLGYTNPTEVQDKVIPLLLEEKDVIVKSETGSGKTASFGIPICEKIDIETKNPQALILTPTRELCFQIKEDIENIGRLRKVRCSAIFGKQPISIQSRELKQRVHVVAGTPGRTMDHIERGTLIVDDIRYLVIDEADKMLDMGFVDQVEDIIKYLPKERVTMLFSATMEYEIESLCKKYMINPTSVEIASKNVITENIEQVWYEAEADEKLHILDDIIYTENPDSCIIFCKTKDNVDMVFKHMKGKGYSCKELHGGMPQDDRLNIMQMFKRGEFRFLIATDVAARGIDIEDLTHIINYDVPVEKESYIHRIGRTGRAGKMGKAITLVSNYETKMLNEIEEYVGYKIPKGDIPSEDEIAKAKIIFYEKGKTRPKLKMDKGVQFNKDITKIYISAGKEKKISAGDIVGAISSIDGIDAVDIGIIDVQNSCSYVDILNGKGKLALEGLKYTNIKGKSVRAEKAKK
jgi:superfamily II DNA/RNA helicase